jgi:hypothetical protein
VSEFDLDHTPRFCLQQTGIKERGRADEGNEASVGQSNCRVLKSRKGETRRSDKASQTGEGARRTQDDVAHRLHGSLASHAGECPGIDNRSGESTRDGQFFTFAQAMAGQQRRRVSGSSVLPPCCRRRKRTTGRRSRLKQNVATKRHMGGDDARTA